MTNKFRYFDCYTTKQSIKAYRKNNKIRHKIEIDRDCAVSVPLEEVDSEAEHEQSLELLDSTSYKENEVDSESSSYNDCLTLKEIMVGFRKFRNRNLCHSKN